jgi:hypothetical protein
MKLVIKSLVAATALGAAVNLNAQTTVTVDPLALTLGYMNVFNVAGPGYGIAGAGAFQFGSSWGLADLTASFSGSTLTLGPNQIGDPNGYWYTPAGGPGAVGNKIMDANIYNQPADGTYTGMTLTFTGDVLSSTLLNPGNANAIGNGWTAVAFIKDFAPDYSSSVSATAPLVNGVFSISLATINDPSRHVQYGFEVIGPDVWSTDVGPFGTVVVNPVPEPTTLALVGMGGLAALSLIRRRK